MIAILLFFQLIFGTVVLALKVQFLQAFFACAI